MGRTFGSLAWRLLATYYTKSQFIRRARSTPHLYSFASGQQHTPSGLHSLSHRALLCRDTFECVLNSSHRVADGYSLQVALSFINSIPLLRSTLGQSEVTVASELELCWSDSLLCPSLLTLYPFHCLVPLIFGQSEVCKCP
jgi:hypothetical protein